MAWFWFIVVVVMQIIDGRAYFKNVKAQKVNATMMAAFATTASEALRGARHDYDMTGVEAAECYLSALGEDLEPKEFDACVARLCKAQGLTYRAAPSDNKVRNFDRIEPDVRKELSSRIATAFAWSVDEHLTSEKYEKQLREITK